MAWKTEKGSPVSQGPCFCTRPANQYDFPVFSTIFQLKYGHKIFLYFNTFFPKIYVFFALSIVYESVQFQVQCGNKVCICTYIVLCMNR